MISQNYVKLKASEEQMDEGTIFREYLQLVFLRQLYLRKFSGTKIYFKGGTAIRFLYNSFRFSEDLDFTCTGSFGDVEKILQDSLPFLRDESGCEISLKDRKAFKDVGLGFRIVFSGLDFRQPIGIRLDFSFREKPLDPDSSVINVVNYPLSNFPVVTHYSKKEILAEKIRALFARDKQRDVFDIWFLLKQKTEISWKMVLEKMKYYPEIEFSKEKLMEKIDKISVSDLKNDLNQFLPISHRTVYPQILSELKEFVL